MEVTLQAVKRGDKGKNEARRHRAAGRLPAIVYGTGTQSIPVTVEPKALSRILHSDSGANTLITLRVEGESDARVLVKEYQLDPITHDLLHADFYRVAMDKVIQVTVPITLKGEAKGVKLQGGIVDFVTRQIEVECLPGDIPDQIDVDITELMMNDGVRVRDLATGGKWTSLTEPETLIVHLVAPRAEEAPAVDAAAEAAAPGTPAEPEVIKKGKTDKDEEKA